MLLGLSSLRAMFGKSGFREGMRKGGLAGWVGILMDVMEM